MNQITTAENKLYSRAALLAAFICIYNVLEGIVAVYVGYIENSLTLVGFGLDSFIEVASNLGVLYMIKRIRENPLSSRTPFESKALKITGYCFYVLSVALAIGIVFALIEDRRPTTTLGGIIISSLSIGVMYFIASSQIKTGKALNSQPIISDAKCTMVCIYMSVVLLVSSFIYELTSFAYADVIGTAGLIYFSIKEGKEALEKSEGKECCDSCHS